SNLRNRLVTQARRLKSQILLDQPFRCCCSRFRSDSWPNPGARLLNFEFSPLTSHSVFLAPFLLAHQRDHHALNLQFAGWKYIGITWVFRLEIRQAMLTPVASQ